MSEQMISYLAALTKTMGRLAFPKDHLIKIAFPKTSEKLFKAYNLADGTLTQAEICKKLKIDTGNFSKTVNKWINSGIMFKIVEKNEIKLLHLYPLPEESIKAIRRKNG